MSAREMLLILQETLKKHNETPLSWKWRVLSINLKAIPAEVGALVYYQIQKYQSRQQGFEISYRYHDSNTCHVHSEGNYRFAPPVTNIQIFLLFVVYSAFVASI